MRILRSVAGVLLGAVLVVVGAAPSASAADNCLLILCVDDVPVIGPIVGGIGDGLEDVLTPETPREEPAPAPQPPAPAPQPPVQPAPAPQVPPAAPDAPVSPQSPGSTTWPNLIQPGQPTPAPSTPSPSPTPTPGTVYDFDRDGKQDDPNEVDLLRLHPLTPFLLGGLAVLFAAISISAFHSLFKRKRRRELRDTRLVR